MGPFLLSNFSSPPPTNSQRCNCKPPPFSTTITATNHDGALTRALGNGVSIILSFGLIFSSPQPCLSITSDSPSSVQPSPPVYLTEKNVNCQEDEAQGERTVNTSQKVTNEGIVEEAWEIVYESFLDTNKRHHWSPETWLQKKEDVLGTSIQSRSKAHDIIRRMLASLGDHYTRFLTPVEEYCQKKFCPPRLKNGLVVGKVQVNFRATQFSELKPV